MRNPRQTVITEALPTHTPIDEAMAAVREAREAHNRAKKALEAAEAILLSRMIEAQVATYDYIDGDGGQWSLTLQLPEQPGLRVKYLGKYENE